MLLGVVVFAVVVTPGGDPISPIVHGAARCTRSTSSPSICSAARDASAPRAERPPARREPSHREPRPAAGRGRGGQHVAIITRPVGRRQDRHQQAVRGPRLHGRRQRAQRAAARPRGARGQRSGALRAGRLVLDVRRATRRWRSARRWARSTAATSSPQIFFLEARDDVAHPPLSARRATAIRSTPTTDGRGGRPSPASAQLLDEVRAHGRR